MILSFWMCNIPSGEHSPGTGQNRTEPNRTEYNIMFWIQNHQIHVAKTAVMMMDAMLGNVGHAAHGQHNHEQRGGRCHEQNDG